MNALTDIPPSSTPDGWKDGLTAKMVAFVEHYVSYRNATQAYTHAYNCLETSSYETRAREGRAMLADERIQAAIKVRQKVAVDVSGYSAGMLLERFLRIAQADPRELIGLKIGCCRYCHGADHQYQWREREYLEAIGKVDQEAEMLRQLGKPVVGLAYPDPGGGLDFNATHPPHPGCPQCHGEGLERFVPRDTDKLSDDAVLLYGGVKVKKDGYEIIIADQQKAAELAGRMLGAFNDKIKISGTIAAAVAVADLRSMDPQDAARAYREFIAGNLAVGN